MQYYKEEGQKGEQTHCARSGRPYQSKLHHDDLVDVMKEIDMDFGDHQDLEPEEKRKLIALNQLRAMGEIPFVG